MLGGIEFAAESISRADLASKVPSSNRSHYIIYSNCLLHPSRKLIDVYTFSYIISTFTMRSAIIFLSIFTANVLAAPLNLCLGADGQGHICKREDGPDTTLNRREPINICLGADGQGYWCKR